MNCNHFQTVSRSISTPAVHKRMSSQLLELLGKAETCTPVCRSTKKGCNLRILILHVYIEAANDEFRTFEASVSHQLLSVFVCVCVLLLFFSDVKVSDRHLCMSMCATSTDLQYVPVYSKIVQTTCTPNKYCTPSMYFVRTPEKDTRK